MVRTVAHREESTEELQRGDSVQQYMPLHAHAHCSSWATFTNRHKHRKYFKIYVEHVRETLMICIVSNIAIVGY